MLLTFFKTEITSDKFMWRNLNLIKLVISVLFFFPILITMNRVQILYNNSQDNPPFLVSKSDYIQKNLSRLDKEIFMNNLTKLKGKPYVLGGNSSGTGFDCSGLIVYLYNEMGCQWFKSSTYIVNDIDADKIYRYNSVYIQDIKSLEKGDFIFFDADSNGIFEHVSIFSNFDDKNNVWVWDASDFPDGKNVNMVSYRKINNLFGKNPAFGRPLKTIEIQPYWRYLCLP